MNLTDIIRTLVENAAAVENLLDDARAFQWDSGPSLSVPNVEGGKPTGGPPADPTGEVASDPRRLRLRAEVVKAERELAESARRLKAAHTRLSAAVDAWAGL